MNDVKAIREARGKTTIHKSASPFPSAENGPGLSPCSLRNCVKKKTKRRRQFTKERRARGWKWMNGNRLARRSRGGRKFHSQSAAAASTFRVWVCVGLVFPAFRSFLGVVWVTKFVCVFVRFSSCRFFCGLITNYAGCASVFFLNEIATNTNFVFFSFVFL